MNKKSSVEIKGIGNEIFNACNINFELVDLRLRLAREKHDPHNEVDN